MPDWFWPGAATAAWIGFLVGMTADMVKGMIEDW